MQDVEWAIGNCYRRRTMPKMARPLKHSWLSPKARVEEAPGMGKGAFAIEPFEKDELIAVWGGDIITRDDYKAIVQEKGVDFRYPIQVGEGLWLGPRSESELDDAEYFNHSCDPNAGIRGQILLVAMRRIEPGEQITFDYAMTESEGMEEEAAMRCNCGSERCRKVITSDDWKDPKLQKRYRNFMSFHIQQMINDLGV